MTTTHWQPTRTSIMVAVVLELGVGIGVALDFLPLSVGVGMTVGLLMGIAFTVWFFRRAG